MMKVSATLTTLALWILVAVAPTTKVSAQASDSDICTVTVRMANDDERRPDEVVVWGTTTKRTVSHMLSMFLAIPCMHYTDTSFQLQGR